MAQASMTDVGRARNGSGMTVVSLDSIDYHTIVEGPPGAPLVVLIHALMANHQIYDHTVTTLHQAGYRTLRYDLVGHNLTPPPVDPALNKQGAFNFDDFCHHLDKIVSTLAPGVTPAAIIGCSIGGVLAIRYHMLYPPPTGESTKIISMAAPGLSTLPQSPDKWLARIAKWKEDRNIKDLAAQTIERWFPDPVHPELNADEIRRIVESCTLDGYEICAWATMNFDYTDQLDQIEDGENVMVLAGDRDENIGPKEVLLDVSKRIKGSQYVLLRNVGHIPPLHPKEFEPVMMDFLKEASGEE